MASSRDDMVLRPRLQGVTGAKPKAEQRAAVERSLRARGGLRRFIANRAKAYAARTLSGAAQESGLARGIGGKAGIAAGAVIVAALVAARLISGKPFEGMGLELQTMLLGDQPQEAIAKRKTREQFQQNEAAMQIAGRYGITDQMRQAGEKLYHLNLAEEVGKNKIDRMFPQDGTLDLIILRLRNLFTGAWESKGIPAKIAQVRETLEEGQMRSIPRIYK
jgi:hypothetical protein